MLIVGFNDGRGNQNLWVSNALARVKNEVPYVEFVQADGDELNHILNTVQNVPYCLPVTIWYGDLARTVLLNTNW